MKSKYIIVDRMGLELPIIFNPILEHKSVAGNQIVISAGFCANQAGTFHVWGGSISLGKQSRPEDNNILNNNLQYDT